MTAPTDVVARLTTVERHSWTYDNIIGDWGTTAGRRTSQRVCPSIVVPNLNSAGRPSPRPPQTPAPTGPLNLDTIPVQLTYSEGQWMAAGKFTHPATLDPSLAALLDTGTKYLVTSDGDDVIVERQGLG